MQFLLIGSAVFLLLLILAADHILNRFIHSAKSRRILAAEGGGALLAGALLSWRLFPGIALHWRAAAGLLLAVPVFIVAAYITVEIWRKIKQGRFDGEIRRLRRETDRLAEELDRIRWEEARHSRREHSSAEGGAAHRRRAQLAAAIDRWQRSGSMMGLRAMKLDHWREELEALSSEELLRRQRALERELKMSGMPGRSPDYSGPAGMLDFDRREQLEIRLGLIELTRLERAGKSYASEAKGSPVSIGAKKEGGDGTGGAAGAPGSIDDRATIEARLVSVQDALTMWEGRRDAFLERKIHLD